MKKIILLFVSILIAIVINAQTEPPSQPTNINFLGVKAYKISLNFTEATGAGRYLVLKSNSDITDVPVDGETYKIGEWIGNSKVIGVGNLKSLYNAKECVANTTYHFAVFAYNTGPSTNYKTDSLLKGSQTSKSADHDDFYDNYRIDVSTAIEDLGDLLSNHTQLLYGDYDETVVVNVLERDTIISNQERTYVVCEYSNKIYDYDSSNDIDFNIYNREHVTAKAWMPSNPPNNGTKETADFFNLFLVKASVNQNLRSAYVFDEVVNAAATELDCKRGTNANGLISFEPKESIKGNIARTLFYQLITYNGKGGSWAFNDLQSYGNDQDVDLLIQWHNQDPVDNFEIARNEYIYKVQGNRNPFVDFPQWVNCIDFKTLTLNGNCPLDTAETTDAIYFINNDNFTLYPNPIEDKGFVKLDSHEKISSLDIIGIDGKKHTIQYNIHNNIADFNVEKLSRGIYTIIVHTDEILYYKKLSIK